MACLIQSEPDKGIAWIILVINTFLNVQYGIILFSFGIFYLEFLDEFGEGYANTSWLGSVVALVAGLAGLFFIHLCKTYLIYALYCFA